MYKYLSFLLIIVLISCSTKIEPTNEYDPDSPSSIKAKGEIRGMISPEDPQDLISGVTFEVSLKEYSISYNVEEDGSFILNGIPEGTYTIRVKSSDSAYKSIEVGPFELRIGSKLNIGNIFVPLKKGSIRGIVTVSGNDDKGTQKVSGIDVFLLSETASMQKFMLNASSDRCENINTPKIISSVSSPDGSFTFENIRVGTYRANPVDSQLGMGYSNDIEVKENTTTDIGEITITSPSALIHIEDKDSVGTAIDVTNKEIVRAVYMMGGFVNEYKLTVDSMDFPEEWKMVAEGGSELVTLPDQDGEHIIFIKFRDTFCRVSAVY